MRWFLGLLCLLALSVPGSADTLIYQGREFEVNLTSVGGLNYLEAGSLLDGLGWYTTDLKENRIGLCHEDQCVPVDLDNPQQAMVRNGELFLAVPFFESVLQSKIGRNASSGKLILLANSQDSTTVARQFPDLTLPQVNGGADLNTLDFLRGRRAIVFCFASW